MEIISHIFELSIPERPPGRSSRGLTKNEICAPLILGAVCQVWRQIAFSTPQIWASISIYFGNRLNSAKAGPTQSELAQEWLSRSGELPLSVYIYGDENTVGANIPPLIEIINERSSRWNLLELELPRDFISLLCGDPSSPSNLRHLRSYFNDQSGVFLDKASFALRNAKPSPTSISLADWPLKEVDIEWNHATHVNLGRPDISECIEVLRRAPQLICFKFNARNRDLFDFTPHATPATPIIRPRLRELEISVVSPDMCAKFVDSFLLSGLETLTFTCPWDTHLLLTNSLISLVNRSSCLLTTLSIGKYSINKAEIFPLLQATPSLRNLHFCRLLNISLFNALETMSFLSSDKPEEDAHVLPGLEMISFRGEHCTQKVEELIPWSLVWKMFGPVSDIHSPHRRPLSKFNISVTQHWEQEFNPSHYIDKESICRFLELREAGITLDFMILNHTEERDLIKLSIEHYDRIDKPSPFSNSSS